MFRDLSLHGLTGFENVRDGAQTRLAITRSLILMTRSQQLFFSSPSLPPSLLFPPPPPLLSHPEKKLWFIAPAEWRLYVNSLSFSGSLFHPCEISSTRFQLILIAKLGCPRPRNFDSLPATRDKKRMGKKLQSLVKHREGSGGEGCIAFLGQRFPFLSFPPSKKKKKREKGNGLHGCEKNRVVRYENFLLVISTRWVGWGVW